MKNLVLRPNHRSGKGKEYGWQPKPGDKFYRPPRIVGTRLRRVLGVPALFSIGYGDVGSSIYYGLGVVAAVAIGATPIALAAAGLIYVFNALTYAEGAAMLPEGGGSASYARHGFNDLIGFIAGWALMLSYIATMAISAYTIPPYLAYFWPVLKEPFAGTLFSMGIIFFLMLINIIGIKESSRMNIIFIGMDIATQITLVLLGAFLILRPHPEILFQHMFSNGNWPSTQSLVFSIALAALCFTGVESVSQHGEETRLPQKKIPQAYVWMIIVVLVLFTGISLVALSAMTPQSLGDPINGWARDPVAGIAANLPSQTLQSFLAPLVAILAATILLTATNAGLLGISRLSYNLSLHKQLPATIGRVHPRFRTPYIAITFFCMISILLLVPGFFSEVFFSELGALYVFGSLLCFALAHAAILVLRIRKPDISRPFRLRFNVKFKRIKLPITALMGLMATFSIWILVMITQPFSRWIGLLWMLLGILIFLVYRRIKHLSPISIPKEMRDKDSFN
jgi:APA family basic amino acid/polyamine antiporter